MPKILFYFIGWVFLFVLPSYSSHVYAEQVNNTVKDCIEQPSSCGEKQASSQGGEERTDNQSSNQANPAAVSKNTTKVGLTIWDFIKMILATIFVVALLYLVLKFMNKKSTMLKNSQLMDNLGGVPLGANRSVQMIRIGKRLFIVGVGENVQLLKEIEDVEEYNQILSEYNQKLDQLVQPNELMAKIKKKVLKHQNHKESAPLFQSMLQQQLNELAKERKKIYEEVGKSEGTDKK
nr:flagellar biosynthetic protein FliO [uncultured Bacillus sp.]